MKRRGSAYDAYMHKSFQEDPSLAADFFTELMRRPLASQLAVLRRMAGYTQSELAGLLGITQPHISRLEKEDADHLLSFYKRVAARLGAHLAVIPVGMALVPKRSLSSMRGLAPQK